MIIEHSKNLFKTEDRSINSKIENVAWSSNDKLAVNIKNSNQVILFDTNLMEKKEKFTAKSNANLKNEDFKIKYLDFNQDGTKIAIAQTDFVIHVYKLGHKWGEKKTITGKYSLQSQVVCLKWLSQGIVFGTADGKIKLIQTTSNRMSNLFSYSSSVTTFSCLNDKLAISFLDGLLIILLLSNNNNIFKCKLDEPVFTLCFISDQNLAYSLNNGSLSILDIEKTNLEIKDINKQTIQLSTQINFITNLQNGNFMICACLDEIIILVKENNLWIINQKICLKGYGLINFLCLSFDGTKLITSSLNGYIDLFQVKWKKFLISKFYEINFIGSNQIKIKSSDQNDFIKINFTIKTKYEIDKIKILKRKYAIIWTKKSLIFSDLEAVSCTPDLKKYYEINWNGMSNTELRFCFDYENVILINFIGELYIYNLINGQLITSVRTDFISQHLMSIRVNDLNNQVFAYLLDVKTILIIDLIKQKQIASLIHNTKIDWIELNETGWQLLFRDKKLNLYLCDLKKFKTNNLKSLNDSRISLENNGFNNLLTKCSFVQWVPLSDVVVAQSRNIVYVFFDYEKPKTYELEQNLQAINIIRKEGETKIILINEEGQESFILLDETYLDFDTALQNGDLYKAMIFLENQIAVSISMWKRLIDFATRLKNYLVLERSLAAIGNLVKSQFVHEIIEDENKRFIFEKNWSSFENINNYEDIIETYKSLSKWDLAIDYANRMGLFEKKEKLEEEYFNYLLENGREFDAGKIGELKGNHEEAINLYLKSNHVLEASRLVFACDKKNIFIQRSILEKLIEVLIKNKFYEEAGFFYEKNILNLDNADELALDCYKKGNFYDLAIQLSRKKFPSQVVILEELYGDYLVSRNEYESSINHFIESGSNFKALNSCLKANDYEKAAEIALVLGSELNPELCKKIANYYLKQDLEVSIKLYLNAGLINEAVKLLNEQKQFVRAFSLVKDELAMNEEDTKDIFFKLGTQFEKDGKLKDAEKIYLLCDQADKAISMYKDAKQYDSMIRLVSQYYPDLLTETHKHLAKDLEKDKLYSKAELHYISANEWKSAVQMYKNLNRWEDAYRLARLYGGNTNVVRQIALLWAKNLPSTEEAVKMLNKYGLLSQVIDEALNNELFEFACVLAETIGGNKLNEIYLKWALKFEEEENYEKAEKLYLAANKPREAVLMYVNSEQFENAVKVAEKEVKDENLVRELLTNEAKNILSKNEKQLNNEDNENTKINILKNVEKLLVRANKIELIINLYTKYKLYDEAIRLSEQQASHLLPTIKREMTMIKENKKINQGNLLRSLNTDRPISLISNNQDLINFSFDSLEEKIELSQKNLNKEEEAKFALILCAKHVSMSNYRDALKIINKFNVLLVLEETKKLLLRISINLFAMTNGIDENFDTWKLLRDTLLNILNNSPTKPNEKIEFEKYLLISHFLCLKFSFLKLIKTYNSGKNDSNLNSINELYLKLNIALLRYTDLIRVDYMFYEAGQLCKNSNLNNFAFMFLNHFLDLVDAIEEQDVNLVDYTNFINTDIPKEVPLPPKLFLNDHQQIEQIKKWILEKSIDNSFNYKNDYNANLNKTNGEKFMVCVVTAYPVLENEFLDLKPGKYAANRYDWNQLITIIKTSLNSELRDCINFIGRLCGSSNILKLSF